MKRNVIETVLGAVVLIVAIMFVIFAYSSADLQSVRGYQLMARFNSVGGLTSGSDVRIGGVKVGSIVHQGIDMKQYRAVVELSIRPDVMLPVDSIARISSDGLLGGKYLQIEPGGASETLQDGDELRETRDSVALEELLGRIIFLVNDESSVPQM